MKNINEAFAGVACINPHCVSFYERSCVSVVGSIGSILVESIQLVENTGSSLFPIQELEELDSNIAFSSFMLNSMELHIFIAEGLQDFKKDLQDVLNMFNAKKEKRLSQTLIDLSLE